MILASDRAISYTPHGLIRRRRLRTPSRVARYHLSHGAEAPTRKIDEHR
jgi:hypothetical protein